MMMGKSRQCEKWHSEHNYHCHCFVISPSLSWISNACYGALSPSYGGWCAWGLATHLRHHIIKGCPKPIVAAITTPRTNISMLIDIQTIIDTAITVSINLVGYVFDMSRHVFKTWRMSSLFRRHISQMSPNVATCRDMSPETCHMGGQKDMSLEDTSN